jgi:hypothetical protein
MFLVTWVPLAVVEAAVVRALLAATTAFVLVIEIASAILPS